MKKHTKKIVTGIILFISGVIIVPLTITIFFFLFLLNKKPLARFLIPAEIEVRIEKEGKYYLWNDYHTTFNGKAYPATGEIPDNLEISLNKKHSETSITFYSDQSISSYTGESPKRSIGYFEIDESGIYLLNISGETTPLVFSFGKSLLNLKIFLVIFMTGVSSMIMGFIGFIFIVIGIIELCKAKKIPAPEISNTV